MKNYKVFVSWLLLMLILLAMTLMMQSCKAPVHHHHYYIIMQKASWPHREEPVEQEYSFKHDVNCSGLHITCSVMHLDGSTCMTCLPNLAWSVTSQTLDDPTFTQPFDTLLLKDDGKLWLKYDTMSSGNLILSDSL